MKPKIVKKINDVLENFDFKKVHEYMTETNWTWATSKTSSKIPSRIEIQKTAKFALVDAYNEMKHHGKLGYCSTGGFHAYCFNEHGKTTFHLLFAIADYEYGL